MEKLEGDGQVVFEPLVDDAFEYECLYQVTGNAQDMKLVKFTN